MLFTRSTAGVAILAPAKLNLFLEVLGKRSDGLHEIETLICPIDLYDTLTVVRTEGNTNRLTWVDSRQRLSVGGRDEPLPVDRSNLVLRALDRLQQASGAQQGLHVELVKRIPWASGLAGGSSDAAAALVAGNLLWELNWSRERLAELAAELGSDVPVFLAGGAAVCRGRGERVTKVGEISGLHFVVVHPPQGLSTAAVYGACRPSAAPRSVQAVTDALARGNLRRAGQELHNQLQGAAARLAPAIGELSSLFGGLDVAGHQMSGSGSSYFGLCRSALHARHIAARLRGLGVGRVYAVRSCANGSS